MNRFSIRSLLLFTAVVAGLVAAAAHFRNRLLAERSAAARLEKAKCTVVRSPGRFSTRVTEVEISTFLGIEGYNPVRDLRYLCSLQRLSINPMLATEDQIVGLQNASSGLQHLNLGGMDLSGRNLPWLNRFTGLKTLRVQLNATPLEIQLLEQHQHLAKLEISAKGFGDQHLASLASLTNLRSLKLDSVSLLGERLDAIQGMRQLETLQIFNDRPDVPLDAEFRDLLAELYPDKTVYDPAADAEAYVMLNVSELPLLPSLRVLGLQKCEFDHEAVSRIAMLPNLVELNLHHCSFPSDVTLKGLKNLRCIRLDNCQPIHRLIESIHDVSMIDSLSITDPNIGFADLAPLSKATHLNTLVLTDIRNDGFSIKLLKIPNLGHLAVWGTTLSTGEKRKLISIPRLTVYDF